jgi:hypothetical protein
MQVAHAWRVHAQRSHLVATLTPTPVHHNRPQNPTHTDAMAGFRAAMMAAQSDRDDKAGKRAGAGTGDDARNRKRART